MLSHDLNATEGDAGADDENETANKKSYKYITTLPLFSLTEEKIAELQKKYDEKEGELELYKNTPAAMIWLKELEELSAAYKIWYANGLKELDELDKITTKKTKKTKRKTSTKKSAK